MLCVIPAHAQQDKQEVIELLEKLRISYSNVKTFTTNMRLERFAPDYALQNQQVWFKRPQYIKLKQLGPYKEGAQLSIKPDGSIRGHLGGLLRFIVVSLEKDDENLYGVTNDSAFQTDFDAILDIAFNLVPRITRYEFSKEKNKLVLDTHYEEKINRYRLIIDTTKMMIVGLERYENNKLLHRISWSDLRLNPELSSSLFDL